MADDTIRILIPRHRLFWVTLAVFAVLLILPSTGWLLRAQWRALYSPTPGLADMFLDTGLKELVIDPVRSGNLPARLNHEASLHPNDFAMQVSAAMLAAPDGERPTAATRTARLSALIARYPDRPALYAHLIRCMSGGLVGINRGEPSLLRGDSWLLNDEWSSKPEDIRQFEQAAACGERLDPRNAYFPMMSAVGLFADHQDQAALAAMRRASLKPEFNDYVLDEMRGDLRLAAATEGRLTSLERDVVCWQTPLPHLSRLRDAAGVATYLAMKAEQSGRASDGLAIRHSVMRCGGLMRADSTSYIGSLVGVYITQIACSRPGEAPVLQQGRRSRGQFFRISESSYLLYLRTLGADYESRWARRELDNSGQVLRIPVVDFFPTPTRTSLTRLFSWWISDLALLSSGLCLLLLAGIVRLRWRRPYGWLLLLTVFGTLAVLAAGLWLRPWAGDFANISSMMAVQPDAGLSAGPNPILPFDILMDYLSGEIWVRLFCALAVVGLPMLLLFGAGLKALICRQPVRQGMISSLRGAGAAIGCVLLLIYAVFMIATLPVEQATTSGINQSIQHEGRYFARQSGLQWPTAP